MDQDKYIALLHKKFQGELNGIEQTLLDHWLKETEINRVLAKKIEEDWRLSEQYTPTLAEVDVDKEFTLLQQRIKSSENIGQVKEKVVTMPVKKRNNWWAYAAAIALAIGVGTWLLTSQSATTPQLVVNTSAEEQKEVLLADGTKVWLNENSQLTYPTTFQANSRNVSIEGEAFFEVQKDATKPFVIETNQSEITVLGTSFNVRALQGTTETEVVVKTGKVRLASKEAAQSVILVANEKGTHQHVSNNIQKAKENNLNELAWKSQVLFFNNTPITVVIKSLERLFKVHIQPAIDNIDKCEFSGRFPQPTLRQVMTALKVDLNIQLVEVDDVNFQLVGGQCE